MEQDPNFADDDQRDLAARRQKGMELTLADFSARQRTAGWELLLPLLFYSVVTIALLIYFWQWSKVAARGYRPGTFRQFSNVLSGFEASSITVFHLVWTLWISKRLFETRQSFFALQRGIHRARNYFRLNDPDFEVFPVKERNRHLPLQFGQNRLEKETDSTLSWRSYSRTHAWPIGSNFLLAYLAFQCTSQGWFERPMFILFFVHVVGMIIWLNRDRRMMQQCLVEERELVGADHGIYSLEKKPGLS